MAEILCFSCTHFAPALDPNIAKAFIGGCKKWEAPFTLILKEGVTECAMCEKGARVHRPAFGAGAAGPAVAEAPAKKRGGAGAGEVAGPIEKRGEPWARFPRRTFPRRSCGRSASTPCPSTRRTRSA